MSAERPNFFIGRHLDKDTLHSLRILQETIRPSAEGYVATQQPHLSHAGWKFIIKRASKLDADSLNEIIFPLPESASQELTLGVNGLKSVQGRREKPYLVIDLDDPEGKFAQEHLAILTKVRKGLGFAAMTPDRLISPHVSLGKVFPENLSEKIIEEIEAQLPESLTFLPVSYPVYIAEHGGIPNPYNASSRQQTTQSKIPSAFLDSLRIN